MTDASKGGKRRRGNKSREVKCGDCGNVVSEMDTGIMCEVCDICHHAKYERVSDEAYEMLQGNEAVHWYRMGCNKGMVRLLQTMSALQERQERMERSLTLRMAEAGIPALRKLPCGVACRYTGFAQTSLWRRTPVYWLCFLKRTGTRMPES